MDLETAKIQCLALFESPQLMARVIADAQSQNRPITIQELLHVLASHEAAGQALRQKIDGASHNPNLIPDGT